MTAWRTVLGYASRLQSQISNRDGDVVVIEPVTSAAAICDLLREYAGVLKRGEEKAQSHVQGGARIEPNVRFK